MLAIVGTVPEPDFPLTAEKAYLEDGEICIARERTSVSRGTPALLAAAIRTGEVLGIPAPTGYLVGDIGRGEGSRLLYQYLDESLGRNHWDTLAFHYLQPDVDWHNRLLLTLEKMSRRPKLIADAGFMYAAKMSGQAGEYDLFTPDIGELAFLADEEAPHPFYTRGFILHEENRVPELIARAYRYENAARYLLVKGKQDFLADREGIRQSIGLPSIEAMEAIGGTGDTLTGLAAAFMASGRGTEEAAILAARANRLAGYYANLTPASQVMDLIDQIPRALKKML